MPRRRTSVNNNDGGVQVPPPAPTQAPQQATQPTPLEYMLVGMLINRVNLLEGILGYGDLTWAVNEVGYAAEYVENRERINRLLATWQNNMRDAQMLIMLLARQYAILYKAIEKARLSEARERLENLLSKAEELAMLKPPPYTPTYA